MPRKSKTKKYSIQERRETKDNENSTIRNKYYFAFKFNYIKFSINYKWTKHTIEKKTLVDWIKRTK